MRHIIGIFHAALFLTVLSLSAEANIATSKHNLSVSETGSIKATSETELCIFCHIPHNANPAVPLWNHTVSSAAYQMYTSDYQTRAGYTTPSDVGQRSRLCLSCHDGTVAIGSVYTVRGVVQTSPIGMRGVDASGKMPSTAASFLGADLRNDHPVSIEYNTGHSIAFGSGSRTMELNLTAPPINPKPYMGVKLYGTASGTIKGYVECTSCHDPHNDANSKFLVVSNANGALCTTCHSKTGWSGSIHQASTRAINNPAGETQPIPGATVAAAACMACHKSHSGAGIPYILRKTEENTCFNGASTSCHSASGAKNIAAVLGRAKAHPVTTTPGAHKNLDVLDGALLGSGKRHAECADCHNPHQAKDLPKRVAAASWYPTSVNSNSNLISNSGALIGATGVNPTTSPLWAVRTTYTTMDPATKEFQVCYKCHSYYAIGNSVTPLAGWAGLSSAYITDQAWEFSPGNKSAHPVEVGLNSQAGSPGTKPLASSQMTAPWTSVGTQTMYCSDCHGADYENTTDPKGPHGSSSAFMLKGPNKYWPTDAAGNLYNTGYNSPDSILNGLFCKNCHPIKSGSTWYNNAHSEHAGAQSTRNVACVACHSVVPHGSKVSRLMVYQNMGAPYLYNGTGPNDGSGRYGYLLGFKKAATRTGYSKTSCYTTSNYQTPTSGDPCSGAHRINAGGYE